MESIDENGLEVVDVGMLDQVFGPYMMGPNVTNSIYVLYCRAEVGSAMNNHK